MTIRRIIKRGICAASAALLLLAARAAAWTLPPPGFISAADYGYNTTDATDALQAAIDSGNKKVWVPNMGSDWIVRPILLSGIYDSNLEIRFEDGVVVAAKAGEFHGGGDCLFTVHTCHDVRFSGGATLKMRQSDYMQNNPALPGYYTPSEFRAGIQTFDVVNFSIEGLTTKDTGGDGLYLGSVSPSLRCDGVSVKDIRIDNAFRNGISVIDAKDLTIDNAVVLNTGGTPPEAGICFETDSAEQGFENCTVRNSIVANNGLGGITFCFRDRDVRPVNPATITIENVTVVGNGADGIHIHESVMPGLTVKDSLVVSNGGSGFSGADEAIGSASGQPRNAIDYSDVWNNAGGSVSGWTTLGEGAVSVAPQFRSTDPNDPYYMYLDPSCSPLITQGASDGGHMGARGLVPEPSAAVLALLGGVCVLAFCLLRQQNNSKEH